MKNLSVLELSKLYGINRQTIYNSINKGILSKNSDGKIDLSEAIRVFGEPSRKSNVKEDIKIGSQESAENILLRQQIDMLKSQLSDAKEREGFYQNQIETMQRLLEAPKTNVTTFTDQKTESDMITNPQLEESEKEISQSEENKRIPVPEIKEEEQPKRGFWSKFFLPNS
ncbi:plasmid replication DNA-binding protein [Acinetobacter gerneri]|nr:plasmid replication DNA-binding protein [Acinetobacter gerneri]